MCLIPCIVSLYTSDARNKYLLFCVILYTHYTTNFCFCYNPRIRFLHISHIILVIFRFNLIYVHAIFQFLVFCRSQICNTLYYSV